ncbi:hypothetical protein TRAPUB_13142 [Trametes pubescens]|uniref:Uncharacterized protein n=1 Tax=Trametes pubescens TaxID=154538 RepID=A0A1M2VRX0_TRAPU|nr:hypothetical protein TRAPUB_13142 [Trametes pubescens]
MDDLDLDISTFDMLRAPPTDGSSTHSTAADLPDPTPDPTDPTTLDDTAARLGQDLIHPATPVLRRKPCRLHPLAGQACTRVLVMSLQP